MNNLQQKLKKEQEKKEHKRKEKAEDHLYTVIRFSFTILIIHQGLERSRERHHPSRSHRRTRPHGFTIVQSAMSRSEIRRAGDVSGSLVEFDRAIELDPRQKAYLWQRGLSLYYLDRFEEGAEQFRLDVAQNPNNTEESIWCFLCEAQLYGVDEARKQYLE
ncbi:hypothetical protein HN51_011874, partial [Arachis hypogaea]